MTSKSRHTNWLDDFENATRMKLAKELSAAGAHWKDWKTADRDELRERVRLAKKAKR
jgi:ribosomal 50S subunit-associated protein YjgA (DUF615 family)